MEPFKQGVPAFRISVEKGTDAVPADGRFHVLIEGQVVLSHSSKARALSEYRRIRDQLIGKRPPDPKKRDVAEALRKEIADAGFRALRAGSAKPRGKLRIGGRRGHR